MRFAGRLAAARGSGRRASHLTEETKRWLAQHFTENCSLTRVAAAMRVSVFYLAHRFRERCGVSIHRFVDQLRLRAALAELAAGDRDLTDLALRLGYSNHSHFSARFRRAFGTTPSAYRASRCVPRPPVRHRAAIR
ncbi:MAG: AraC family transcriptional regulator [Thermoanaerobaculia bacterium]